MGEGGAEAIAIERRHLLVAHDDDTRRGQQWLGEVAHPIDEARADDDVVAAAGQLDAHETLFAHGVAPVWCGGWWTST